MINEPRHEPIATWRRYQARANHRHRSLSDRCIETSPVPSRFAPPSMELCMKTFLNLKIGVRLALAFAFVRQRAVCIVG